MSSDELEERLWWITRVFPGKKFPIQKKSETEGQFGVINDTRSEIIK